MNNVKSYKEKPCIEASVVMLPTENQNYTELILNDSNQLCFQSKESFKNDRKSRKRFNLYFTIDEEIKEKNWYFRINPNKKLVDNIPFQATKAVVATQSHLGFVKIVTATDESLKIEISIGNQGTAMFNSLPSPSNAFIQKYVEMQGKIDKVLIEMEEYYGEDMVAYDMYPATMYRTKVAPDNTITTYPVKDNWNKQEITNRLLKILNDAFYEKYDHMNLREKANFVDKWIEQNL